MELILLDVYLNIFNIFLIIVEYKAEMGYILHKVTLSENVIRWSLLLFAEIYRFLFK